MPIRVPTGASKQVPVDRPANIRCHRVAEFLRLERDGMILVDRLTIDHRLYRCAIVIGTRLIITAGKFRGVPILTHIEGEPFILMEPLRRTRATWWMKGA